jgi:hypothetical protein
MVTLRTGLQRCSDHGSVRHANRKTKYAVVAAALEQVWNEFDAARGVRPDDLGQDPVVITRLLIWDAFSVWRRHGALLNACAQARASDAQLDAMYAASLARSPYGSSSCSAA